MLESYLTVRFVVANAQADAHASGESAKLSRRPSQRSALAATTKRTDRFTRSGVQGATPSYWGDSRQDRPRNKAQRTGSGESQAAHYG